MSSSETQPPRNRLSIAHLMLWTLGSAVILAGFRAFNQQSPSDEGRIGAILSIYYLFYSLPLGAQAGSVALWILRRWRGPASFPVQPGHWLLLVEGLSTLIYFAGYAIGWALAAAAAPGQFDMGPLWLSMQLSAIAGLVGYSLAWQQLHLEGRRWRAAIAILLASHALTAFAVPVMAAMFVESGALMDPYSYARFHGSCCVPLSGLSVLIAAVPDIILHRAKRDYLHWAGIAALVLIAAMQLALPWVFAWAMNG